MCRQAAGGDVCLGILSSLDFLPCPPGGVGVENGHLCPCISDLRSALLCPEAGEMSLQGGTFPQTPISSPFIPSVISEPRAGKTA